MKEVTDPGLLAELNKKMVMDPALLAQLEGTAGEGLELTPSHEKYSPPTIPERMWSGFKSNLWDVARLVAKPTAVGEEVGTALGQEVQTPEGRARLVRPITESIEQPSGIPGRLKEYAIDNPLNTALMVAPAVGTLARSKSLGPLAEAVSLEDKFAVPSGKLSTIVRRGMEKGIRPTVVGKSTQPQIDKYYRQAESAVKSIIRNKENLEYVSEAGEVKRGQIPQNLNEFSDSVHQTMKSIFNKYDAMAQETGKTPVRIQLEPIAKELDKTTFSRAITLNHPETSKYLKDMAKRYRAVGSVSPAEAQELIADFNNSLKAFYRTPTYDTASRASIDSLVANRLRASLDEVITKTAGPGYQELKNEYGALRSIEKDVAHRNTVDARKNVKGLVDFSHIWSNAELVRGLLTMRPEQIAMGTTARAMSALYKRMNNPNQIVKTMFEKAEKAYPADSRMVDFPTIYQEAKLVKSAETVPVEAETTANDLIATIGKEISAIKGKKETKRIFKAGQEQEAYESWEREKYAQWDKDIKEIEKIQTELEKKGYTYLGLGNKEDVGNLSPGTKIFRKGEEYTVSKDKHGRVKIRNGETLYLDLFEKIDAEAIKYPKRK